MKLKRYIYKTKIHDKYNLTLVDIVKRLPEIIENHERAGNGPVIGVSLKPRNELEDGSFEYDLLLIEEYE